MNTKAKRWQLTLWDWDEGTINSWVSSIEKCKYGIMCWEEGDKSKDEKVDKYHMHAYIIYNGPVTFGRVKRDFPTNTHIERCGGDHASNIAYIKKGGNWWEHGEYPSEQGERTDLKEIWRLIKEGKPLSFIRDEYPSQMIRYGRGIKELAFSILPPAWRDVIVEVYYGASGTGKTRRAMLNDSVYKLNTNTNGTLWFDGYEGEDVLLLDDFYGWIKYGELLTLLDGYRYRCQIKGGSVWARWSRVIITSNKSPEDWYEGIQKDALFRRIEFVWYFGTEVTGNTKPSLLPKNTFKFVEKV